MDVYFDDLKVTHELSDIVAGADYYPFGLKMDGREITREDFRFGYQGQFAEEDEQTGWNSFELRMYDPVIGRWVSTDPYGQFWSPYVAFGNNPVNRIDPDGGLTGDPKPAQGIGLNGASIPMNYNFDDVIANTAPGLAFGGMALSGVTITGNWSLWDNIHWRINHGGGGMEFYNSGGWSGNHVYHVRDGIASHAIVDVTAGLNAFGLKGRTANGTRLRNMINNLDAASDFMQALAIYSGITKDYDWSAIKNQSVNNHTEKHQVRDTVTHVESKVFIDPKKHIRVFKNEQKYIRYTNGDSTRLK